MTLTEALSLFAAAAAGGAINAVAGGGTLITFPALLAFGTPPIIANATSTFALVVGTGGGIFGFREHLPAVRSWLYHFVPVSLLGGLIGSLLLTFTSNKTFAKLVPFLIFFATILFLAQGVLRRMASSSLNAPTGRKTLWSALLFQFFVAIYGGYFGAGIGILMLASLGFIGLQNIHQMNTLKTILGSLINAVAAAWFVYCGLINWPEAGIMILGALAGYYAGSSFSQKIPQVYVRRLITAIGLGLTAVTFYQQFIK